MFYLLKSFLMSSYFYAADFYKGTIYASTNAFGVKQKPIPINYDDLLVLALSMFLFLTVVIGSYYFWAFFIKAKKKYK